MKFTPKEIAELLKERPNQPHYIEGLVRRAVEAEREECARLAEEPHEFSSQEASRIAAAIRARGMPAKREEQTGTGRAT